MTTRSSDAVVTFTRPFAIGPHSEELPAGTYRITIEEDLIEGLSFAAYHRTSTVLEVPAIGRPAERKQYLQIAADELEAALERDRLDAESGIA
ncbi:MAG: hypothetical protein KL863_01665 [Rhizobium sp.]|nr:hypothetical protein [Rhizobium sp.]